MSTEDKPMALNPWRPMSNPLDLAHLGKLAEELGEAVAALAAAPLAVDWVAIENELADVAANTQIVTGWFDLKTKLPVPGAFDPNGGIGFNHLINDLVTDLGTAVAATARCIIQGIDGVEPVTGRINREWLADSLSKVAWTADHLAAYQDFDVERMMKRAISKYQHLRAWHELIR